MGDLQVCSLLRQDDVVLREDRLCASASSPPPSPSLLPSNPDPALIEGESWERAEQATRGILCRIQPTVEADQKRREVIDYVQGLIKCCLGCEVFAYGSVPLKTYLPDGDIDLTAICSPTIEETVVLDTHAVLRREENNEAAKYEVKDIHRIDAEVKLIKCLVENIVVDISFNQLGGLCTLCFLEQVDRLVGKDHLFKRSIILIKAWCYYESRILGAHHGLISTYALETLVLYIFHLFHSSLNCPLAVLYRFLDYFSGFDWENYCISLNGPVRKTALPDIVAEVPENGKNDLLLSQEFLKNCSDMFSVPSRRQETNSRAFPLKHLNIIDPLKENNNLGRSVNRGNFYRIRSAFKFGSRKLGRILSLPRERIADELSKFFANTLERHESSWTDLQNYTLASGSIISENVSSSPHSDTCSEDNMFSRSWMGGHNADQISIDEITSVIMKEQDRCSLRVGSSPAVLESNCLPDRNAASQCCHNGDVRENCLAARNSVCLSSRHEGTSPAPTSSEYVSPGLKGRELDGFSGNSEFLMSLLDLSGDYDSHIRGVLYGQDCTSPVVSTSVLHFPPMSTQLRVKNHWETVRQSMQSKQGAYSQMNTNGVLGPQIYHVRTHTPLCVAFGSEEKKKQRGTGTYIPNMNYCLNRDRTLSGRGGNQAVETHVQSNRHTRNTGSVTSPRERNSFAEGSHELSLSEAEYPVLGHGKPQWSPSHQSFPTVWGSSNPCGFSCPSEKIESGTCSLQPQEGPVSGRTYSPVSYTWCSVIPATQDPNTVLESNEERVVAQLYHLKNEVDFPPLSVGKTM